MKNTKFVYRPTETPTYDVIQRLKEGNTPSPGTAQFLPLLSAT